MRVNSTFAILFLVTSLAVPAVKAEDPRSNSTEKAHPLELKVFGNDDRAPSSDLRIGRLTIPEQDGNFFCTGWLLSNGAFVTAGHCALKNQRESCSTQLRPGFQEIEFNVPSSLPNGTPRSNKDEVFPIDTKKVQCQWIQEMEKGEVWVKDWAIFALDSKKRLQVEKRGFFRPVSFSASLPPQIKVTGFSKAQGTLNLTQQTASGKMDKIAQEKIRGNFFNNPRHRVATLGGDSGAPLILKGTSLVLGVHDGGNIKMGFNYGTGFGDPDLAAALHLFPGTLLLPQVTDPDAIFYVDADAPGASGSGNFFAPFSALASALEKISAATKPTLISVVTGSYPENIEKNNPTATPNPADIEVILRADTTLVMPVGSVTLWGKAGAPPG